MPTQLSAAAEDFGFTEEEKDTYLGGYVMAAFFLVGAPAALVVRADPAHCLPACFLHPTLCLCHARSP